MFFLDGTQRWLPRGWTFGKKHQLLGKGWPKRHPNCNGGPVFWECSVQMASGRTVIEIFIELGYNDVFVDTVDALWIIMMHCYMSVFPSEVLGAFAGAFHSWKRWKRCVPAQRARQAGRECVSNAEPVDLATLKQKRSFFFGFIFV